MNGLQLSKCLAPLIRTFKAELKKHQMSYSLARNRIGAWPNKQVELDWLDAAQFIAKFSGGQPLTITLIRIHKGGRTMPDTKPDEIQVHQPIWVEKRFDVLKLRFDDQVTLLRKLTDVDLQIFGGYLTISLAFGSWLSQHPIKDPMSSLGLAVICVVLAVSTTILLLFNFKRRLEVVETVKNLNVALGYESVGAFIEGVALNAKTTFRPWRNTYYLCIGFVFIGQLLLLLGAIHAG